jgi:voltage-gated potassium channel
MPRAPQVAHLTKPDPFRMANFRQIRSFRVLYFFVLAVGLVAMTAMTAPNLSAGVQTWVLTALWCCLSFFVLEFFINTWPRRDSKLRFIWSAAGLIDLLAVLPIPIALLVGVPANTAWLLASLWILKLATHVPGLSSLWRVLSLEARPLATVFIIFLTIFLLASVALYVLERAGQPNHFGSIPLAMWWAVTTLTTTGYGDALPATFLGRLIASIVMICGLGVFGLWTGILATGFAAEHRRRDFIHNWDLVTRVPFLKNLEPPTVIELTRMLRRLDLADRTMVVRRGRPGDCMYFIASGEVEVKVEPHSVRLGAGSFFGEMALLTGAPRTANVVTTQPSTLLVLEAADFHTLTAHHPDLARAVATEAQHRTKPAAGESAPHQIAQAADKKSSHRASR